jgi:quercetin dioxygenase-like cupin family protein
MASMQAAPLEAIDVAPWGEQILDHKTTSLIKTAQLDVLRLALPSGKVIPEHKAVGEITVQCLEGRIVFTAEGKSCELVSGQMLHLGAGIAHSLQAKSHSSVLVTIVHTGPKQ